MAEDRDTAAPGWYPTPDGEQRYWDGRKWLSLPSPGNGELEPSGLKKVPRKAVIASVVVLVALILAGGAWKVDHDSGVEKEQRAAQAAEDSRAAEAKRLQDLQTSQDTAARSSRATSVSSIEESVKTMADGHVEKGIVDGPVLSVSCSPVSGGSTDDLTETTTAFECFAASVDNGDGTQSGYKYHATMNWTSGEYTYGLGAP